VLFGRADSDGKSVGDLVGREVGDEDGARLSLGRILGAVDG
jgi:hypothetical protein